MRLLHKYFFAANGDCIGYHGWDADKLPPPDNNFVDQMPPVGSLADANGKEKYKQKKDKQKEWDDGKPEKIEPAQAKKG